jgi:uncharacterized protein YjbJ (UPF0337 family)
MEGAENMTLKNKAENVRDAAKGSAKEKSGRVQNDRSREAEGKAERAIADLKQAGEKVKDAVKDLKR